jgi:hypothetical protein
MKAKLTNKKEVKYDNNLIIEAILKIAVNF